jgi:hypothetical protein
MARDIDPYKLSSPQIYLWRMGIFLVLAGFVAAILFPQIYNAFMANPGLNGLIIGVLFIGILLALRQVIRLFPEIRWVNGYRLGDPALEVRAPPPLIAPMATLLGDRIGHGGIAPEIMRSILDSIGMRLDETRDIVRYFTGLLIFLGLLGTFWGLQDTVGSVGRIIQSLQTGGSDVGVMFEELKAGLAAPLGGMGTAFASSLFGLAGSLVLGFLDLQGSQAQNRFYTELEDWLGTLTAAEATPAQQQAGLDTSELRAQIERLAKAITDGSATGSSVAAAQSRAATAAMADLAEGIQGLVQHMRSEQQLVREWVEAQADRQKEVQRLLEILAREHDRAGERELRLHR